MVSTKGAAKIAGKETQKIKYAGVYAWAIAFATVAILYFDYYASVLGIVLQVGIALLALVASGMGIRYLMHYNGGYGLYMLSGKHGIREVDAIAQQHKDFWSALAMWGMVLGFGLFSYPLLKGRMSKRVFALGIASLFGIIIFVLPFLSYSLLFINIPRFNLLSSSSFSTTIPTLGMLWQNFISGGIYEYVLKAIIIVSGFSGYIVILLVLNAGLVLDSVIKSISIDSVAPLSAQTPGVAPVIPGIDLPLISGVLSLAIILIVHEFSHGILARTFKVKLKSIGLLLFGVVPVGAFVEPDDAEVNKLETYKQNRIFSAGVSANFLFMIIFLIPMLLLLPYVLHNVYGSGVFVYSTMSGYPAYNVVKPGSEIFSWDDQKVDNTTQLSAIAVNDRPGSLVKVSTSTGNYTFVAKAENATSSRGLIGVDLYEKYFPITNTFAKGIAYFFYSLFGISFMLNFLVGVVNLLPVPGFDGWRIYANSIKRKTILKALTAIVLIALLMNVLPWI